MSLSKLGRLIGGARFSGRDVTRLALGAVVAQGLTVAASPLITRLYGPEEFGLFAVYFSFVSAFSAFGGLRYNFAIPVAQDDNEARSLLFLSILATIGISLLTGLVLGLGAGRAVTRWLGEPGFSSLIWLVPVGIAVESFRMACRSAGIRAKKYHILAQNDAGQAGGRAASQICGGFLAPSAGMLLAGDLVARAIAGLVIVRRVVPRFSLSVRATTSSELLRVARRFRRFPLLSAPAAALNSGTLYLPTVLIAGHYGAKVAGFLALTQRIVAVPLLTLGTSILEVYYGRASELRRAGVSVERLFRKTLLAMTIISLTVLLPVGLMGSFAVPFVFGESWREAGVFLRILLPMYIIRFIATGVGPTLAVMERQDLHLLREITRSAMILGGLWFVLQAEVSARRAITVLMGLGSLGYALHIMTAWRSVSAPQATRDPT